MQKEFEKWIKLKQIIHGKSTGPKHYNEGEIWWTSIEENIGIEINGKGESFTRPLLIYKKLSKEGCLIVPLSTQIKYGSWYAQFSFKEKDICANLAQIRVIATNRLYEKMGELPQSDIHSIKKAFHTLYV